MKSSLNLDITATARRDIRAILRHSRRVWGEEQRREYAERLDSAMLELMEFPLLGSVRNEISEGLRALVVGQHLILYQADDQRSASSEFSISGWMSRESLAAELICSNRRRRTALP